jgi:prevent-host-death family protein
MIRANIFDVKEHLSDYLDRLPQEGEIILCKRNVPIAKIVPIRPSREGIRSLGGAGIGLVLDERFWEPLDLGLEGAFSGL